MIKKTIKNKKETIYPVGFLQDNKSPSIFCNTLENPKDFFVISSKKGSFTNFSKTKEKVVIKQNSFFKSFNPEEVNNIISSKVGKKEILTFTYGKKKEKLYLAVLERKNKWVMEGPISSVKEKGGIVSDFIYDKKCVLYYGESSLWVSISPNFKKWFKFKEPVLKPRPGFFDRAGIKFIASKVTKKGIMVFYESSYIEGAKIKVKVGAALFSANDPAKIIWRSDEAIFEEDIDSITLNTDLLAYVSRDGGSTFNQITLSDEGNYITSARILSGTVDISGQPSGTSMVYKIVTDNNKFLKLHGTGMLWS